MVNFVYQVFYFYIKDIVIYNMKNLLEYINDSNINIFFETLDANINYDSINESLQSTIMMDVVKQITSDRKEQKEQRSSWGNYNWYTTPLFKDMFRWQNVAWDKVTDNDFEICKVISQEETDKKVIKNRKETEKLVKSIIKGNGNYLVFLRNPKDNKFSYFIDNYGSMFSFYDGHRLSGYKGKEITQSMKISYVEGMDIYILDLNKFSTTTKRQERATSREGVIYTDEQSLRKIASENIRRYKEIIAKNKSARLAEDDTIAEEVQEIVNRVLELTIKYNKDIVKYADVSYKMSSLMELVYDKQVHTGYQRGKATYRGKDGLLYYFARYMESKKSALKDNDVSRYSSNSYYNSTMTNYKNAIEKQLEKIDKEISEIEGLMK